MSILVIKLSALGDMVLATSAFKAIREHHKDDQVTLLTTKPYEEFGRRTACFDQVWIDERPRITQPCKLWRSIRRLRNEPFARVYDLQNVDRTRLYHRLMTLAHPVEWVGLQSGYSHYHNPTSWQHQARFSEMLKSVGIDVFPPLDIRYMAETMDRFGLPTSYAVLVPGASAAHRDLKCWPADRYRTVCDFLLAQGLTPVIVGGPGENNSAIATPGVIDLTGKTTLFELIGVMAGARMCIGSDSGPSHMAVATGCPTLTFYFGPLDPQVLGHKVAHFKELYAKKADELEAGTVIEALSQLMPQPAD
jgi:ADP-heptose:LPS heptosyltransferase